MGRTLPTYRGLLERTMSGWDGFRRALRRRDREAFDSMAARARSHSSASGFRPASDPLETVFMSILLEHEKDIAGLKAAVEEVRAGVGGSGSGAGVVGGARHPGVTDEADVETMGERAAAEAGNGGDGDGKRG